MKLLVVESPSKAKTINQYLGKDFIVMSSYGHIRALPSADGSVDPDNNFAMKFEILDKAEKNINSIVSNLKKCSELYLATDPDREGEAISWHLLEILKEKNVLKDKVVKRVVFFEITKKAILEAISHPRDINDHLVDAQQTRQAMDYLVGFRLSPVLWRKLPGSRSAGRVQSVALRIICDREDEIEKFNIEEYWSIVGNFANQKKSKFSMRLTHHNGSKLEKLSIKSEAQATAIELALRAQSFIISNVEKKEVNRYPQPPFTTSTMLQEASKKFGFSAKKTSRIAQDLYEGMEIGGEKVGLITYMRTDSVSISNEALSGARSYIQKTFDAPYLPHAPKTYKTKTKNAQEAHEAIRPTDINRSPEKIKQYLDPDHFKLYELIWKRLLASQMANAVMDATTIDASSNEKSIFRASGQTIKFDGFLKLYEESIEDADNEEERILPPLVVGEAINILDILKNQHFTQPPPRYTEASLVKKLEELGIGRPSTFPSIITILTDRDYATLDKKRFHPSLRGRIVTVFLKHFFSDYVEFNFTANLEDELDDVSNGEKNPKDVLNFFWKGFSLKVSEGLNLNPQSIQEVLERDLEFLLFGKEKTHTCSKCNKGNMSLKFGKFGAFLGCSNYPECNNIINIGENAEASDTIAPVSTEFPFDIGKDENGSTYQVKKGPYGLYIEREKDAEKKRSPIPSGIDYKNISIAYASMLCNLPKKLGKDAEGNDVTLGIGPYGSYVKHLDRYYSLKAAPLESVDLQFALEMIRNAPPKKARPVKKKAEPKKKAATKKTTKKTTKKK